MLASKRCTAAVFSATASSKSRGTMRATTWSFATGVPSTSGMASIRPVMGMVTRYVCGSRVFACSSMNSRIEPIAAGAVSTTTPGENPPHRA